MIFHYEGSYSVLGSLLQRVEVESLKTGAYSPPGFLSVSFELVSTGDAVGSLAPFEPTGDLS